MPQDTPDESARPPFYMLHVCGGGPPVVFHDTFESAAKEAERIALKENKSVAVLQGVAICIPPDPHSVVWEFADNVVVEEKESEDTAEDLLRDFGSENYEKILNWLFPRK
jgi:hypothetical protein